MALPVIAGVFAGTLGRMIASRVGTWAVAVLLWFGLSFSTTQLVVEPMLAWIQSLMGQLPGDAVQWVTFFNLDLAVSMILSAYAARASIGGLRARLVRRPGGAA
jgi:hypothetical protein